MVGEDSASSNRARAEVEVSVENCEAAAGDLAMVRVLPLKEGLIGAYVMLI